MLGMMLLHPEVRERFTFKHDGDESIAGRYVERLTYRETVRPTIIKTTRGKDLALTGRMWIEPTTGVVVKTEMIAADPIVRAQVTVTFRRDGELGLWVPEGWRRTTRPTWRSTTSSPTPRSRRRG